MSPNKSRLAIVLACFMLIVVASVWPRSSVQSSAESSPMSADFSWTLPIKNMRQSEEADIVQDLINLETFSADEIPGRPELPVQHQVIKIPKKSQPKIEILVHETIQRSVSKPIAIAPQPAGVLRSANGEIIGGEFEPAHLSSYDSVPTISIEEIGTMAGQRYARMTFAPIQLSADGTQATVTTNIQANITFTPLPSPEKSASPSIANQNDPAPDLFVEVENSGIVSISHADLVNSGIDLNSSSPQNWQLSKNGQPVPMHFAGDNDAQFESNEQFLFYNAPSFNRWSKADIYGLSISSSEPGSRIATISSIAANTVSATYTKSLHLEEDQHYTPNCFCGQLPAGHNGDRWTWHELRSPGNESATITFGLEDFDPNGPAEALFHVIGFTDLLDDNDHGLSVRLNNQNIGTIIWDGKTAHSETLTIPTGALASTNTLILTLDQGSGAIDGAWLDAIELSYTKGDNQIAAGEQLLVKTVSSSGEVAFNPTSADNLWGFDLSNPAEPALIDGGLNSTAPFNVDVSSGEEETFVFSYEADLIRPAAIRAARTLSTNEGQYILIAPDNYHSGLNSLVELRQSQGLTVALASLEGVYDQFGDGNPHPDSIKNYLQHAYDNWSVQPKYVVLVGDGTYDPKLNLENSKPTILPVNFASVDPWAGEIPSDNRYALLDGDDLLPDIAIGRLPVNSTQELAVVVNKLVNYPANNYAWQNNITFVADNPDSAGNFSTMGDTIDHLIESTRYNINELAHDGNEDNLPALKTNVLNKWGSGQGHLVYAGHSTVHQWADEGIIHISQVEELQNRSKQPIILQMTCFTGSYQMPGLDSFDEALLRHENGGGIAVWGSTGLGVATGHDNLIEGYFEQLKHNETTTLGDAVLAGKLNLLVNSPSHTDLLDTFTLLGDPALVITTPQSSITTFLPVIQRGP